MKNIFILFFFSMAISCLGQHTFSIVAIDAATGKIGSAGATCLTSADCGGCGGAVIISDIVPGKGAINAQATVCIPNSNLNNGIDQIENGSNAEETLNWLLANDDCQFGTQFSRQYGIVTIDDQQQINSQGFTGSSTLAESNDLTGANYSIQGNILIGTYVLDSMESRFLNTQGTFEEKMMAALQGANIPGADSRCLSDGISSKSSFLRIANPDDTNGNFTIDLVVPSTNAGVDPIDSLQSLFNELGISALDNTPKSTVRSTVFPNPSNGDFMLKIESLEYQELEFQVFDLKGVLIQKDTVKVGSNEMHFSGSNGAYIYQLRHAKSGLVGQGTLLINNKQ